MYLSATVPEGNYGRRTCETRFAFWEKQRHSFIRMVTHFFFVFFNWQSQSLVGFWLLNDSPPFFQFLGDSYPISYSSSTSCLHLFLGLPSCLFHSKVVYTILLSSIRATCSSHALHSALIWLATWTSPIICLSSWFIRILHVPSTFLIGPYVFLKTFRPNCEAGVRHCLSWPIPHCRKLILAYYGFV